MRFEKKKIAGIASCGKVREFLTRHGRNPGHPDQISRRDAERAETQRRPENAAMRLVERQSRRRPGSNDRIELDQQLFSLRLCFLRVSA